MTDVLKKISSSILAIIGAAIIITAVYFYDAGKFGYIQTNIIRYLSDGFFVTSVLYLCLAALISIAGAGGFSGFRYLTYSITTIFLPGNRRFDERKSYFDFLEEKTMYEQKKSSVVWGTGLICLVVAILLSLI